MGKFVFPIFTVNKVEEVCRLLRIVCLTPSGFPVQGHSLSACLLPDSERGMAYGKSDGGTLLAAIDCNAGW
jgi:hypothetical protein